MATWDSKRGVLYHEFNKFSKGRSLREVEKSQSPEEYFPLQ